jgi:small-conductance mechanosensitive channel
LIIDYFITIVLLIRNHYHSTRFPIYYRGHVITCDDIVIHIDYQENPIHVKELLQLSIESHPKILKEPKPIIRLVDFTETGYLFMIRGYIHSCEDQVDIMSEVRLLIVKLLYEHNITISPTNTGTYEQKMLP